MQRTLCASVLSLLIFTILPVAPLQAGRLWTVTAGGTTKDFAVVANTFQPRRIEIAGDDTVMWKFKEFHTVTFLSGQPPLNPFAPQGDKLYVNPKVFFPVGDRKYDTKRKFLWPDVRHEL